jgi:hypothetical protein
MIPIRVKLREALVIRFGKELEVFIRLCVTRNSIGSEIRFDITKFVTGTSNIATAKKTK